MDDNLFTNETEIKYPSLEDPIDIRVLNNNTKLLSEQEVDFSELNNLARESSTYSIENKVDDIDTKLDSLATSTALSTLNTTTNTINTKIDSLATASSLEIVSNKIDNLTTEEAQKWWTLPNIYGKKIRTYTSPSSLTGFSNLMSIYYLNGSGNLISASVPYLLSVDPGVTATLKWQLLIDGVITIWNTITIQGASSTTEEFHIGFGIHNIQSGCPFNDYTGNHNVSNILSFSDETGVKTESILNYSYLDQTYLNTNINGFPNFHTNVNTNHITPLVKSTQEQAYTVGIYNQKSTFGYPQANSYIYFYDDTSLSFSSNLQLKLQIDFTTFRTGCVSPNHGDWSLGLTK